MDLSEAIAQRGNSTLVVSLSSNPGKAGEAMHNAGYRLLELDYKYVACKETDISNIHLIKDHGVRGASIAMPFKEEVIQYLDVIDHHAEKIGAVNTVVNMAGTLVGYNTDVAGARAVLNGIKEQGLDFKTVIVVGYGGAARAVIAALQEHNAYVTVVGRDAKKVTAFTEKNGYCSALWGTFPSADLLINCTPVDNLPVDPSRYQGFFDLIVGRTQTAREMDKFGIPALTGEFMTLHQAAAQFELYTGGETPPLTEMWTALYAALRS
jgi:shikimate dehydrogenase